MVPDPHGCLQRCQTLQSPARLCCRQRLLQHAANPTRSRKAGCAGEFAAAIGAAVQPDAPLATLSCLPAIDDVRYCHPAVLPMGRDWRIDRFNPATLGWTASSRDEAAASCDGLFRFFLAYKRDYFSRGAGNFGDCPGRSGSTLCSPLSAKCPPLRPSGRRTDCARRLPSAAPGGACSVALYRIVGKL